jgi:hypothetical protein
VIFRLTEYVQAEVDFIGKSISALSRARGGIVSLIRSEPTNRIGTTRITVDSGEVVEFETAEIAAPMSLSWEDIAATNVEPLLATVDGAAGIHHEELTKWVLQNIEKLATAAGNTVDASGKSLFESVYEMFEKIELSFEDDGQISKSFAWVMHPDMIDKFKQMEREMTEEQQQKLDALIDRKREEFFARRGRRKLS